MTFAQLIKHFETQAKAAAAIGLKQPTVSDWQKNGIPYLRQLQFQAVTHGKLKADPLPLPNGRREQRA